jgi:hypothetical protein
MMLGPKVAGKRPITMTGSGGSNPPRKCFCDPRWFAMHLLHFFLFTLRPCFLTLARML